MARAGAALSIVAAVGTTRSRSDRTPRAQARGEEVRQWVVSASDSLDASLARLGAALDATRLAGADSAQAANRVRAAFVDARTRFKHIEGVVEFYAPAIAASSNSRRQEVDDDDAPPPSTLAPGGFPALEPIIWPEIDRAVCRMPVSSSTVCGKSSRVWAH